MIPVQVGVGAGRQREGGAMNKREGILFHHHGKTADAYRYPSSQFTITYSSRFTVFLSYCVNKKLRCTGGKATFPKLSARIWV